MEQLKKLIEKWKVRRENMLISIDDYAKRKLWKAYDVAINESATLFQCISEAEKILQETGEGNGVCECKGIVHISTDENNIERCLSCRKKIG